MIWTIATGEKDLAGGQAEKDGKEMEGIDAPIDPDRGAVAGGIAAEAGADRTTGRGAGGADRGAAAAAAAGIAG